MRQAARTDTIFALATPSHGGVRMVLRVSGPLVSSLHAGLFASTEAFVRGAREAMLELGPHLCVRVRVLCMPGPRSATGEDALELHLPRAPGLVGPLHAQLTAGGARPAEPGEFTLRAVLNGKLDLLQAEGVLALIRADDEALRREAIAWWTGARAHPLRALRADLLALLVPIELNLDFADQDVAVPWPADFAPRLIAAEAEIQAALGAGRVAAGERARPVVVLDGPANAGKSTLFNALVGADLAIAAPVAGTTRDPIRAGISCAGQQVDVIDLAGQLDSDHPLDRLAEARRAEAVRLADIVLAVQDGRLAAQRSTADARAIDVWTHADLLDHSVQGDVVLVSGRTGQGIEALRQRIAALLNGRPQRRGALLDRHASALALALEALGRARTAAELKDELLLAADLHAAVRALDELLGTEATADLLERIFSQFCIGK